MTSTSTNRPPAANRHPAGGRTPRRPGHDAGGGRVDPRPLRHRSSRPQGPGGGGLRRHAGQPGGLARCSGRPGPDAGSRSAGRAPHRRASWTTWWPRYDRGRGDRPGLWSSTSTATLGPGGTVRYASTSGSRRSARTSAVTWHDATDRYEQHRRFELLVDNVVDRSTPCAWSATASSSGSPRSWWTCSAGPRRSRSDGRGSRSSTRATGTLLHEPAAQDRAGTRPGCGCATCARYGGFVWCRGPGDPDTRRRRRHRRDRRQPPGHDRGRWTTGPGRGRGPLPAGRRERVGHRLHHRPDGSGSSGCPPRWRGSSAGRPTNSSGGPRPACSSTRRRRDMCRHPDRGLRRRPAIGPTDAPGTGRRDGRPPLDVGAGPPRGRTATGCGVRS